MSVKFALRGDNTTARFGFSGNVPLPIYTSGDTPPASISNGAAGVFGGTTIALNAGTAVQQKGLNFPSRNNFSANPAFSILMRIVPGFTSGAMGGTIGLLVMNQPTTQGGWVITFADLRITTSSTLTFRLFNPSTTQVNVTSSPFDFTAGVPTDIMIVWDGTTLSFVQDGTIVSQSDPGDPSFQAVWTLWCDMLIGLSPGDQNLNVHSDFEINEFVLFDDAEAIPYAPRTDFIPCAAFDGTVNSDPGISNVRLATGYEINGTSLVGTAAIPAAFDVRLGVAVGGGAGTCAVPTTGQTMHGVAVDVFGIGTYRGYDLWDAVTAGELEHGITVNQDGAQVVGIYRGADLWTAVNPVNLRAGITALQDGVTVVGLLNVVLNVLRAAVLTAQGTAITPVEDQLAFTQGDSVVFNLIAEDGDGNPIDLTGAVFTSYIRGPIGSVVSFPNAQHTANPDQVNFTGQFTLALTTTNTSGLEIGNNRQLLTKIVQSPGVTYFHGINLLNILAPVPIQ